MFKLKKHLGDEHGKSSIDYVLGIFVLVVVVIIGWRVWCFFTINIVNPILSSFGSGISTQYCNIKFDTISKDIESWLENVYLPQITQFDIEFPPTLAIIVAVVMAVIVLIAILSAQIHAKQDTIKRKIQYWYSAAINIWPFKRNISELLQLRLDAAVPEQVYIGRTFVLAVALRLPSSPILTEEDLTRVETGDVQVSWPKSAPCVHLKVQVSAPECEIHGDDNYSFQLYSDRDSPVFYFSMTPKRLGDISIIVEVHQENNRLGSARVRTTVRKQVIGKVKIIVTSHDIEGEVSTQLPAFSQIEQIDDITLQDNLLRAVNNLTVDNVDLGLFDLAKLFENELKAYLSEAKSKGKFVVTAGDLKRLASMIDCIERNGIVKKKYHLDLLRDQRNLRAHGKVPTLTERKKLMLHAPFLADLYIDYIVLFHIKRNEL